MAKQVTVTAYTFDELSDKAKDKARQWMREGIDVDWWSDQVTEDAAQVGIKIESFDVGRAQECELSFKDSAHLTAKAIMENHGDACDTTFAAAEYLKENGESQRLYDSGLEQDGDDKLQDAEETFAKALSAAYLTMLREAYEYAYSDEAVDETILANEYLFTEDGSRTTVLN